MESDTSKENDDVPEINVINNIYEEFVKKDQYRMDKKGRLLFSVLIVITGSAIIGMLLPLLGINNAYWPFGVFLVGAVLLLILEKAVPDSISSSDIYTSRVNRIRKIMTLYGVVTKEQIYVLRDAYVRHLEKEWDDCKRSDIWVTVVISIDVGMFPALLDLNAKEFSVGLAFITIMSLVIILATKLPELTGVKRISKYNLIIAILDNMLLEIEG